MTGEVVRYNVFNGRFAIFSKGVYIVAQLRAGAVAEGLKLAWDDPIHTPAHFGSNGKTVEATIIDVDVPGREVMDLLGPW